MHEECSRLLRNPVGHTLLQWGATGGGCAGVSCKAVDEVNPFVEQTALPRRPSVRGWGCPLRPKNAASHSQRLLSLRTPAPCAVRSASAVVPTHTIARQHHQRAEQWFSGLPNAVDVDKHAC